MLKQNVKNEIFLKQTSSQSPPSVSGIANLREKKNNKGTKKIESRNFAFNRQLFPNLLICSYYAIKILHNRSYSTVKVFCFEKKHCTKNEVFH